MKPIPLYVDLDGTLVKTDTLWESCIVFLKSYPEQWFKLFIWLKRGKAGFKTALNNVIELEVETLPYRPEVIAHILEYRAQGGDVMLATAAHKHTAQRIADHLNCFSGVIATNEGQNAAGQAKLALIEAHAHGNFSYIGNDRIDLPIWQKATQCLAVASPSQVKIFEAWLGKSMDQVFSQLSYPKRYLKALRVHQWIKNSLIFIPLLLAHRIFDISSWILAILAFLSFSLAASAIYCLNDLLDLSTDRRHPRKRFRPFANGDISIPKGLMMSGGCMLLSLGLAWMGVSGPFLGIVLGYIFVTLVYSSLLKRIAVVDILLLAFFYVYRLIAGSVATNVPLTPWLFAFAAFLFVSLGCIKRVSELRAMQLAAPEEALKNGRGYQAEDLYLLTLFGVNAGFLSTVILALYLNSLEVMALYTHPIFLWGVVIVLLYWLMRLWLLTWRGHMHDDPVIFTITDRVSQFVGLVVTVCVLFAL